MQLWKQVYGLLLLVVSLFLLFCCNSLTSRNFHSRYLTIHSARDRTLTLKWVEVVFLASYSAFTARFEITMTPTTNKYVLLGDLSSYS